VFVSMGKKEKSSLVPDLPIENAYTRLLYLGSLYDVESVYVLHIRRYGTRRFLPDVIWKEYNSLEVMKRKRKQTPSLL